MPTFDSKGYKQPLTHADLAEFARFGIDQQLLLDAGVHRVTDLEARAQYCLTRVGDMSSVVFPYNDPVSGDRVSARLRRAHPEMDANGRPEAKHLSPLGDSRHIYFS